MTRTDLLAGQESPRDLQGRVELGRGYALVLPRGRRGQADVYHHGGLSKRVNLRDKAARRLLVVELMRHGVNQTRLAEALKLSRQTLHNNRENCHLLRSSSALTHEHMSDVGYSVNSGITRG